MAFVANTILSAASLNSAFDEKLTAINNVVEEALVINVSTSSTALRITQSGSGNAFVVEDVSSDSTPFVINANGDVSIGANLSVTSYASIGADLDVTGNVTIDGIFTTTNTFLINVNSSSTGFRITQAGSGNAFVIEDSASDSTPFLIDASGNVAIGSTTAPYKLTIEGNTHIGDTLIMGTSGLTPLNNAKLYIENDVDTDTSMYTHTIRTTISNTAYTGVRSSSGIFIYGENHSLNKTALGVNLDNDFIGLVINTDNGNRDTTTNARLDDLIGIYNITSQWANGAVANTIDNRMFGIYNYNRLGNNFGNINRSFGFFNFLGGAAGTSGTIGDIFMIRNEIDGDDNLSFTGDVYFNSASMSGNGASFSTATTYAYHTVIGTTRNFDYGLYIAHVDKNYISGNVGIGTTSPTTTLDINGNTIRIRTANTPANTATGNTGDIRWDSGYVYICTSTNHWKRAALSDYAS